MNRNAISTIRIGFLVLLGVIIVGYSAFQAEKLIRGPVIEIYSPQNGSTYSKALIEIEGLAKNIAHINLNGRKIFTDKNGYFKEKLLLSPGYNIIKLDAEDKFNQYEEEILEVVLKEY
ncbi:MAG: hypothetical protein V4690_02335 [Patescibacteria group bacterium]